MRIGALEACPQVFNIAPIASQSPLWCLPFRAPARRQYFGPRSHPRSWYRPQRLPFASLNRQHLIRGTITSDSRDAPPIDQEDPNEFIRGPKRRERAAWVAVLDHYLPQNLRLSEWNTGDGIETPHSVAIEKVPLVLDRARQAAKVDLLCYIGVYQERWQAVHWLVTAMLAKCPPYIDMKRRSERFPTVLWDPTGPGLDEITLHNITVRNPKRSPFRLDAFLENHPIGTQRTAVAEPRQFFGALWQSLGSMLLEVEDRSSGNPNRPSIMSHVLQILADMHHRAFLPDTIYNYDLTENSSMLRRPPMLHLVSERMLADLSDISWKTRWLQEAERAESDVRELSQFNLQPQMPRMGPEVWLEFVLWTCVEGGWIVDAAWLVNEIQRRRDNPERRWSVISWKEILSRDVQELGWFSALKRELEKSGFHKATEIAVANRATSNVTPDLGTRRISREVILAITDGLANIVADNHLLGNTVAKVQNHLLSCQGLLARGQVAMDPGHVNPLILRAIETSGIDARLQPGYLQMLLGRRPPQAQSPGASLSFNPMVSKSTSDVSAPVIGLLHRLLNCYVRQGNLRGSLLSLRLIQEAIDSNRDIYIQDFADELRRRLVQRRDTGDTFEAQPQSTPLMLYPEIPPFVVEAFLDLLIDSRAFELGHWVLFNNDIDGGILNSTLFSDILIQPALLRFATATANEELLLKVLENLETPLPESTLHALLRCQVAVNRWDGVEGILKHLRDTYEMAWTPADAMTIAAAIPTLEWKDDVKNIGHSLQAKGLLQALIQGEFNSPQNHAQIPDLQEIRTANQLGRIFQSVKGALGTIELGSKGYFGRANYSVKIPSDAFGILLASVVQAHGSLAGIKLWERWCLEPDHSDSAHKDGVTVATVDGGEKVVQPSVSMLRLILQPVTESLKNTVYSSIAKLTSEKSLAQKTDQDGKPVEYAVAGARVRDSLDVSHDSLLVFDWCIEMYRKVGFSDREILREIPASFGRIIEEQE